MREKIVISLKKCLAAIFSLGFSLILAAFVCLLGIFLGAYQLPVKTILFCSVPLALLLFFIKAFERKSGYIALTLLTALCAVFMLTYYLALDEFMKGEGYQAPDVDRKMFSCEKVLILSPHQDDEMNMLAGTISEYSRSGAEVYVVYSTCGDSLSPVEYRWPEAVRVLEAQGVKKENVIFLGYGDSWQGEHIYDGDENAVKTSYSGHKETYGTSEIKPYRANREYTKNNFLEDLKEVILEIKADVIFCVDYDLHEDHRALSLAFEDVMGQILREEEYRPVIMKSFAYSTAWNAERDYHEDYNVGKTENKYPTDYLQENNIYLWSERLRLPVQGSLLARYVGNSQLNRILLYFQTQSAAGNAEGIINSDRVVWHRPCESLTYKSEVEVSSGEGEKLIDFAIADSDKVSGEINFAYGTWIPEKTDDEKNLTITLPETQEIGCVYLNDNPSTVHNVLQSRISFDDGSAVLSGALEANGSATRISFEKRSTKTIKIELLETEGEEAGLAEVEIYENPPEAPYKMIKLCSADGNFIYDYLTENEQNIITLHTVGIGDELSEEKYSLSTDNKKCSAQIKEGAISLSCPKGERCTLSLVHLESGEYDSISVYCMKTVEKIKRDFSAAFFDRYSASLNEQRQRYGWIEEYNALFSLLELAQSNYKRG